MAKRLDVHAQLATHAEYAADSQDLLQHCGRVLRARTVWQLADRMGYSGPVELVSMWLCLLSGSTLCSETAWSLLTPRARVVAMWAVFC